MNKTAEKRCDSKKKKSRIIDFFHKQTEKMKHGDFKCPFCSETFSGISNFGSHLKQHCT